MTPKFGTLLFITLFSLPSIGQAQKEAAWRIQSDPMATAPNAFALKTPKSNQEMLAHAPDLSSIPQTPLACDSQTIWPAHPYGTTKLYHVYLSARYDHLKLQGNEPGCLTPTKPKKGTPKCIAPDTYKYLILSDTFKDECANYYRGFWEIRFLQSQETMETLFSKGRTLVQRNGSTVENDFVTGPPYSLRAREFIFFSPLFPNDLEKIKKLNQ